MTVVQCSNFDGRRTLLYGICRVAEEKVLLCLMRGANMQLMHAVGVKSVLDDDDVSQLMFEPQEPASVPYHSLLYLNVIQCMFCVAAIVTCRCHTIHVLDAKSASISYFCMQAIL